MGTRLQDAPHLCSHSVTIRARVPHVAIPGREGSGATASTSTSLRRTSAQSRRKSRFITGSWSTHPRGVDNALLPVSRTGETPLLAPRSFVPAASLRTQMVAVAVAPRRGRAIRCASPDPR